MKKATLKKYSLVPSLQLRGEGQSPTALLPVVPVQIDGVNEQPGYAIIDTASKISWLRDDVVAKLSLRSAGSVEQATPAGPRFFPIVKLNVTLLDPEFGPWVRLPEVPFIVRRDVGETGISVALGFDSCLVNLRLTIDYSRKQLSVSAPPRFVIGGVIRSPTSLPSRIAEAERLLELGSYHAAVALAAAGLEELLIQSQGANAVWETRLARSWAAEAFDDVQLKEFTSLWALRNTAVHGGPGKTISRREATAAVGSAKYLAEWLAQQTHSSKKTSQ